MRYPRILFLALICCAVAIGAVAQDQAQAPPPSPNIAPPTAAPPPLEPAWIPEGVGALGQSASSRTEFTLSHGMLVMASKFDKDNEDLRRVIAGINEVAVRSFRFPGTASCDRETMESIGRQYREAGWTHLVKKHKNDGGHSTDLWVRLDEATIRDIAVLFVGERQVNFVSVAGSITPLDLMHLSGHFGIPKLDGAARIPAR